MSERCEWCDSALLDDPVSVTVRAGTVWFCHGGCLVHWLFSEEPSYFTEIFDTLEPA